MRINLSYTPAQAEIFFPPTPRRFTSVAKGRRFGATRGAAHACIEWAAEGQHVLWGDTINSNVKKYWQRYFEPALKASSIPYSWHDRDQQANIGRGYIDFRSADRPENWEGFGYNKIILNEAGIILKDEYLFSNAVLPMLMDHEGAELYAMGVPKGKELKSGKAHPFWTLYSSGINGSDQHRSLRFSSYDNPFLRQEDINDLAQEIAGFDPMKVRQEIYGEFIDRVAGNPFAHAFDDRHIQLASRRPQDVHYVSVDFNVDPFCAIIGHIWTDRQGDHLHITHEISIKEGTIRAMADRILAICPHRHLLQLTGDRNGRSRKLGTTDNMPLFEELRRELGIGVRQIVVLPNPTHLLSREEVNFTLVEHPDLRIDPTCTGLIRDLRSVEIDGDGRIVKDDRSQVDKQADLLDCLRYLIHTRLPEWMKRRRNELHRHPHSIRPQPLRPVGPSRAFELGSGSGIV